jgi:hypothetical protein
MSPWLVAIGGIMQNFLDQFDENDRRTVRKWRLATLGFYGSILAGLVVYAALHWTPEVNYASVDSAAHARLAGAPGNGGRTPFAP